jgi:hypothetical protein
MPYFKNKSVEKTDGSKDAKVTKDVKKDDHAGDSKAIKQARKFKPSLGKKKAQKNFTQSQASAGILVTSDLQEATARCAARVKAIAKDCRLRNRRFRSVDIP